MNAYTYIFQTFDIKKYSTNLFEIEFTKKEKEIQKFVEVILFYINCQGIRKTCSRVNER